MCFSSVISIDLVRKKKKRKSVKISASNPKCFFFAEYYYFQCEIFLSVSEACNFNANEINRFI